jgi:hypothetical protein
MRKSSRASRLDPPPAAPEPRAQRNFTDPESRILKTKDGYIQGYNAQAAVDAQAQIIVAQTLSNSGNDQAQTQFGECCHRWCGRTFRSRC